MAMAAIPIVLAGVSAAVSAVGAVRSAQAQAGAANYNAELAQQNAQTATMQGQAAAEAQQRDAARRIGASLAAFGASGVQTDTGSPTDVMADSVRQATLDNLTTQYNYKLRATGQLDQAGLDRANASNATQAGVLGATSALIGGASKGYYYGNSGGSGGYGGYGGTPIPSFG